MIFLVLTGAFFSQRPKSVRLLARIGYLCLSFCVTEYDSNDNNTSCFRRSFRQRQVQVGHGGLMRPAGSSSVPDTYPR